MFYSKEIKMNMGTHTDLKTQYKCGNYCITFYRKILARHSI
ncbi:hypothetical protein LEP1GSC107_4775 [Leptospira interrogans serovar Grippotyphosa str. UI 12769]|uniref:Uncharacterized protein n=1 Tax=Leptospira interrogans str. FPW1039 TaxID=1193040 RepID=A0A0F6IBL1_LEPIR|nr:hypothetical protein LEP1GSC057_3012 [Leptospira interrogans str. Brem 329]EKR26415.1 hypothetical protein LEP1GSC087_4027 [Leptospira interrogans serovar Bataviae str. L1111]EKR46588.1 hypothetical protein LEP1GSC097_4748 [Leptospira interrogans serovar Grippotyphosa str. UI 08368]EMJ35436.1 hypothetical protein LEP1GSC079_4669 [Leptospira interrogans str. FPW1039]EMJ47208.1 hypothetical protein LEP1GSC111_0655 [Leptospira interrogans str. UT126]EMN83463.1 hypothetical protein LEP1GSC107_4